MSGWIKLHRDFINWEWFSSANHVKVFITLLLSANYEEKSWKGKVIKPGQIATGRKNLSLKSGVSEQSLRTVLRDLKSTNEITIEATRKFSIISITNWEKWQSINQEPNFKSTTDQPTTNHQSTTTKEIKKEKKVINIYTSRFREIVDYLNLKSGKNFKASSDKTQTKIKARLNEGYSLDDFKTVIDNKVLDSQMGQFDEKYLRPETLFGPKFEGYLNQGKAPEKNYEPLTESDLAWN